MVLLLSFSNINVNKYYKYDNVELLYLILFY